MANPHFAKFADIWKHLPLLEVLRIEQPRRYWETHAGTAFYPLTPSPEREYGVYHFLREAGTDPTLSQSAYYAALTSLPQRDGFPADYPGSAALAMLTLGDGAAEYILCDKDPASAASLEAASTELGLLDRTRVLRTDGPGTIRSAARSLSPGEEGGILCHIDPFNSFAAQPGMPSSVQLFEFIARSGIKAVYWYAYEAPDERGWLISQFPQGTRAWCGDILLPEPDSSGLIGLGVGLANVSERAIERCGSLGRALERIYQDARLPSGARGSVSFAEYVSKVIPDQEDESTCSPPK